MGCDCVVLTLLTEPLLPQLVPGETALAFYSAHNPTSHAITGIATYNVIPFDAGQYFNKIQVIAAHHFTDTAGR